MNLNNAISSVLRSVGKLQVRHHQKFNDVMKSYHYCSASLVVDGAAIYSGYAVATCAEIAETKALAELYERVLLNVYGLKNSNGCAVHTSRSKAEFGSRSELIERDRFFSHYINSLPFLTTYRLEQLIRRSKFKSFEFEFTNRGIQVIAREMLPSFGMYFVVLTGNGQEHSKGKKFGIILGCGSGRTIKQALEKAMLEFLIGASVILTYPQSFFLPRLKADWKDIEDGPIFHMLKGLDPTMGSRWLKTFVEPIVRIDERKKVPVPKSIMTKTFPLLITCKGVRKFYFSISAAEDIQEPFWGIETANFEYRKVLVNRSRQIQFRKDYLKSILDQKVLTNVQQYNDLHLFP